MTSRTRTRIGLGIGAALLAVTAAAGVYAAGQDNPPQPPFGGRGGPGRFGGPGGPGMPGPGGDLGLPLNRLDLSEAQREQVKAIVDSHRDEMRAIGDRARKGHDGLEAAVTADTIDEGTIRSRAADVAVVEADMAVMRARVRADVWQILTPDQQTKAKQAQAEMQQRRAEMEQRRGQRPPR